MSKKVNYPITRAEKIAAIRTKHSNIQHDYYSLCEKHVNKTKYMMNFTVKGRGRSAYTKLKITNEIKSHITKLIANSKSDIYFFSNIEMGHSLSNPHLHTQIWSDDKDAVKAIYDKVIKKFSLVKKRCKLTLPQQTNKKFYDYILKDYSKNLSDNEVWNLEETKKRMRKTIGKQIRFISKSKGKYTKKLYKMVYFTFGVARGLADKFLDTLVNHFTINESEKEYILYAKKVPKLYINKSFICIKNKRVFEVNDVCQDLEILFYSPSNSPPILLFVLIFYILI